MDVTFRPILETDFPTICNLLPTEEELFLFYAHGKFPFTIPQLSRLIELRMEPTVVLYNGEVVGFSDYYNYHKGQSVFIGNIAIHPSVRGNGVGKRLVNHMIERAFYGHDLASVRLHVFNRNLTALLLYNALGFRPYAMKVKKDYKGEPVLQLSLGLSRETWLAERPPVAA